MTDLRGHYLAYLTALNERRFDDLAAFVAPELTYNGEPTTLADYQAARRHEAELIPDLAFRATTLVADATRVAAVLHFDCTPAGRFLDLDVAGRRLVFTEHVFYEFDGPLVVAVDSLLDVDAIRRRAASPPDG